MGYLIGFLLALAVSTSASMVGLDKDRAFYPTILAVIASYYELFAVIGGAPGAMVAEGLVAAAFLVAMVLGFKRSLWIVVGALAAHGALDFVHPDLIANPGVPAWWPMFCMTYDVTAALYLAVLLRRERRPAHVR